MSKILCKLGWHKYSRHYEILPLPASDPLQATIFKVCINCGKWWRGRDPETFKRNGIFSIVERKRADYNMPDTDTPKNLQGFIDELREKQATLKKGDKDE